MEKKDKKMGYFKRIFKGPLNSIEECNERKADLIKILIPSLCIMIAGVVLNAIGIGLGSIIMFVGMIPSALFAFLLFIVGKAKSRFEFFRCDECKHDNRLVTEGDVGKYVSLGDYNVDTTVSKPSIIEGKEPLSYKEITVRGSIAVTMEITLECTSCGAKKKGVFTFTPFKCEIKKNNIKLNNPNELQIITDSLTKQIKDTIEEKLDDKRGYDIPVTVQSIYHPNYANKEKLGAQGAREQYGDVTITYHRYVEEMISGYFINNELNLSLKKDKKKKASK